MVRPEEIIMRRKGIQSLKEAKGAEATCIQTVGALKVRILKDCVKSKKAGLEM